MGKIHILPDTLINQIAAGEVVERPASVVKELLENSLDAGASMCRVEIEQGGTKLITVGDNGYGMDETDARIAFERHATSKIHTQGDLERIASFGFRGEALAAIGSVAMVKLRTRSQEDTQGCEVIFNGGSLEVVHTIGCPTGTNIEVRNLFFNTPARKKFLKSEITELSNIVGIFNHIALSHPAKSFELVHNGKMLSQLPATSDLKERLAAIIGHETLKDLLPVSFKTPSIYIHGFIAKPGVHHSSRRHQYLFVNGRDITDALVARAVTDAYGSRLPARMYPLFLLHIDLNPRDVDVNVHPRKLNVKFLEPQKIYKEVMQAISQGLDEYQGTIFATTTRQSSFASTEKGSSIQDAINFSRDFAAILPNNQLREQRSFAIANEPHIISQVANAYILILEEEGLAILDQHAAHERILYERLRTQMLSKSPSTQPLLIPMTLECDSAAALYLKDAMQHLENMGFQFEAWSGQTMVVQACPVTLASENLTNVLKDFLEEVMSMSSSDRLLPETILKSLACKGAVKFGMVLSLPEQKKLLEDLANTSNNSTCPHGRPTKILMSFKELEQRFYRRK